MLLGGCKLNKLEEPVAQPTSSARIAAEQTAYRISYDVETMTRRKLPDGAKSTTFDQVEAMPTVRRHRVELVVDKDGNVSFTSEKLTPEQVIGPKQYPDKLAKTVMQGGTVSFYDASGKLLSQQEVPVQNVKPYLDEMVAAKKAKKNTNPVQLVLGGQDVDAIIEVVRAKGGKITALDNGFVETDWEQDLPQDKQANENTPKRLRFINLYDTQKGLSVGAEVYNAGNGAILSRTVNNYRTDKPSGQIVPNRVFTDSYLYDAKTGKTEARTEVATYRNYSFTDNLN